MYAKGLALECKYTSKKGPTTLSYMTGTRKALLSQEASFPKGSTVVDTNLGKGVTAYLLIPDVLHVQEGTLTCVIANAAPTHEEALAKVLLKSYW